MSNKIQQIQLTPERFHERFASLGQHTDPFGRVYFITTDQQSKKRAIYKHYLAETEQQTQAIFGNIENYLQLNAKQGMCKIVACTHLVDQQEVLTAFEYDEWTLAEYLHTKHFYQNKPLFYIQMLTSIANIAKTMEELGIDLDELNYGNILVQKQGEQVKFKIFYDEREKFFEKIVQGVKTFTSAQKLTAMLTGNQDYYNQLMERPDYITTQTIYQLGLILIDMMYIGETQPLQSQEDDFMPRDRPVSRSMLNPDRSYYHIEDGSLVTLNSDYVDRKILNLQSNSSQVVKELANLAREMIAKQEERITLNHLMGEIERVFKIYRDSSKKISRTVSSDSKKKAINQQEKSHADLREGVETQKSNKNIQNQQFSQNSVKNSAGSIKDSRKQLQSERLQPHAYEHENILSGLDEPIELDDREQDNNQNDKKFEEQNNLQRQAKGQSSGNKSNQVPCYEQTNGPYSTRSQKDGNDMGASSGNGNMFSSYSSHKNDYTSYMHKGEKMREAANSNALSTTKETITSKTHYTTTALNQQTSHHHINIQQSNTYQDFEKSKLPSSSQTKLIDVSNQRPVKQLIPKEHILMNLKAHESIKSSLQSLIREVQCLSQLKKKQYYDNSVYYGEVNPKSNKRSGLGLYIYPSGDIYFGTWLENQLVNGTYVFKNGESYEGSVKNGKQGWGRYRYSNGNVYEGEWKDDIKEGKGTMWYPNQDKYEGQWVKGKKNGWGKYFYNNGTIYEGNFQNGRKQGFGTISFPNGTKIQANWQQTHVQGEGKVFYPNGDYFQGEYHMSQKHGKGLYVWSEDNTKYEGQFKKDVLEGEAKIYFTQNQYYFGRIRNGRRDGQGKYAYENGDMFNGEWKNDIKLIGHYRFSNGDQFEGKFKDNQLNFGVLKYANGEIYEGEFKNGFRHGVGSYRDRNGQLVCEGHWDCDNFVSQPQSHYV